MQLKQTIHLVEVMPFAKSRYTRKVSRTLVSYSWWI